MLALAASKTWNYHASGGGVAPFTVTTYSDPQPSNGNNAMVAYARPSIAADALPADGGTLVAAAGFSSGSDGPHAQTFGSVSNDSYGYVPGTPLLVPTTLSLGQVFSPMSGITGTVTAIGPNVPGIAACPGSPPAGATVSYVAAFDANGSLANESVTYVPGCGITDLFTDAGVEFKLASIASHPELGELSVARQVLSASWIDTIRSLWQMTFHRRGAAQ
jgi:hypothetical protein